MGSYFKQLANKQYFSKYLSRLTIIKLLIAIVLIVIPNVMTHTPMHGVLEILELVIVYFVVLMIGKRLSFIGYFISSIFTLLIIAQEWVKVFGGTYTTKVMLDNVANIHALGPALPKYITIVVIVVIISFLPIKIKRFPSVFQRLVLLAISAAFFAGVSVSHRFTAITSLTNLVEEYRAAARTARALEEHRQNEAKVIASFKKNGVTGGIDTSLKKPNVIVIFAEGTSRTVIEQSATKYPGLMQNVENFSKQSIDFTNYYNHTAPTYKGLRGQLFSAFQYFEGFEGTSSAQVIKSRTQTPIIGLPSILGNKGYKSAFINPEPNHKQFTPYLNQLGFDQVISGSKDKWTGSGQSAFVSDKENFELLFKQAESMNNNSKEPFFLGTYTLQTHNSWNVKDNPYGDGNNAVLNKFHNFDVVFGEFLKKFMNSELKDNTILILTTDHASYSSPDYAKIMDDSRDSFVSTIPLMIYYPGVKPQTVDVKGRNSLGLAPTILDLLNIKQQKNYFLGTSLFTNNPTKYEFSSEIGEDFYSTKNNKLIDFSEQDAKLKKRILQFDSFSLNMK